MVSIATIVFYILFMPYPSIYIKEAFLGTTIPGKLCIGLGPSWFFLALFFCRIIYLAIAKSINRLWLRTLIITLISSCVIITNKIDTIYYVPYQITQGLVALFYYHIGALFTLNKKSIFIDGRVRKWLYSIIPISMTISFGTICYYSEIKKSMNLSALDFPLFPIDFVNALFLSFSLYLCIDAIVKKEKFHYVNKAVAWFGKGSLVVYFIHCIEYHITIDPLANFIDTNFSPGNIILYIMMRIINPILQIAICVCGLFFYQRIKLYNKNK